jgi:4-alpha-glucanotransferase
VSARRRGDARARERSRRGAGVLLHPTSLPGGHPIGDLGPAAHGFLGWLAENGLRHWQVLPLGPTGFGDSPYTALSAFAGNPLLISPEGLVDDGLLPASDAGAASDAAEAVDFAAARALKERLHRSAWEGFARKAAPELVRSWEAFREGPARLWLEDWALFAAIKASRDGGAWTGWEEGLRRRRRKDLDRARRELDAEIELRRFEQFLFQRQWSKLRDRAAELRIELIGDVPIYVALDSADVWARRRIFAVDRDGRPRAVAGVPPDYFSATGQRWGHPLYRWRELERRGFDWWVARVARQLELTPRIRLDHFRGFVAYWRIPGDEPTAENGRWVPGPGRSLFAALAERFGEPLPLIAEDLGDVDEPVHALRRALRLPGMRVLQFAFADEDSLHAPHRHTPDCVVYTGTHDNDTCRGWIAAAPDDARRRALVYLGADEAGFTAAMVRAALTSVADLAILPIQDLLDLGGEARMNVPGREAGNWSFRLRPEQVSGAAPGGLRELLAAAARTPPEPPAPDRARA